MEQWLLSVQHDDADVDRFAANFRRFAGRWPSEPVSVRRRMSSGGAIRLAELAKAFDGVPAVTGIHLDIPAGQFYSLLGASGCGKTTTLRMIAGFERPDSGRIELDGRDVVNDPPHKRPVNTVFQSYALFPFMTVWDNVAFGLRYQNASRQDVRTRWTPLWNFVRMDGYAKRKPGPALRWPAAGLRWPGRWCCARGCCCSTSRSAPWMLRKQLQLELRALQREVGITFVYVTHDQEEALTMSDQIAVLAEGRVEQVGPAGDLRRPGDDVCRRLPRRGQHLRRRGSRAGNGSAVLSAMGFAWPPVDGTVARGPAAIVIRRSGSPCWRPVMLRRMATTSSTAPWPKSCTSARPRNCVDVGAPSNLWWTFPISRDRRR